MKGESNMELKFVYKGKNSDVLLIVDTEKKHFIYWTDIEVEDSIKAVFVKSRKDIKFILDTVFNNGYALKIS